MLKINTGLVTVKEFRDEVLIKALNMVNPDVMLDGKGIIVLSSEEGETEENEDKLLKDMQIVDGCILKCDDFFQNYELTIIVLHISTKHDEPRFEVIADKDILKPVEEKPEEPQPGTSGISNGSANGSSAEYQDEDDDLICVEVTDGAEQKIDDDCEIVEENQESDEHIGDISVSSEKRKAEDVDDFASPSKKRPRIQPEPQEEDDDIVCIDDD